MSPFGLIGILFHKESLKLIKAQFPKLQSDIENQGMAAYLNEVAIDTGYCTKYIHDKQA